MTSWGSTTFINSMSGYMKSVDLLHDWYVVVLLPIMVLMLVVLSKFILSKGSSRSLLHHEQLESWWTIFPSILMFFLLIPSLVLMYYFNGETPNTSRSVEAHQWYWSYNFDNNMFTSDSYMAQSNLRLLKASDYLSIPMEITTMICGTSADVLHSFAVPAAGIKMDCVPGRINSVNLCPQVPGMYYGQCSELCGVNHSFMPINLAVVSLK